MFSPKKKKKKCAWLSLAACFQAKASASVFRYLKEEKKSCQSQTAKCWPLFLNQVNLLSGGWNGCLSIRSSLKKQIGQAYFITMERSSVSQYHVSPLHSTCCSWNTIPHYSWQSVHSDKCSKELKSYVGKKSCQFIIMLDEKKNAVSECGTKPVCISGIYLLCFYWQVLWLKFASVTVYYPVHTRGCENLE